MKKTRLSVTMFTFPDDRPKNEVDVERTDSGVGGDLGQSHLRRSWEEIVMKSSEQWSVVAASARHWQELARRRKAEQSDIPAPRKKSSAHSITEDMVCFVCLVKIVVDDDDNDVTTTPMIMMTMMTTIHTMMTR